MYLNGNQTEFSPYTTVPYNSLCNGNDWARNIATPTVGGQPPALLALTQATCCGRALEGHHVFATFTLWDMHAACNVHMGLLSICCVPADLAGMHYYVDYGPSEAQYTQSLVGCLPCTPANMHSIKQAAFLLFARFGIELNGCASGDCTRCLLCSVQDLH